MPIGGVYDTGTVAVTNGSATVVGTGVFWPDVLEGDHLIVAGLISLIASVDTGTNTITLLKPYLGATNAAATYQLVKMSWLRYDPSTVMYQTRDMLSRMKDSNTGLFYYTTGTPDPAIGDNGDLAIDVSSEFWVFWMKVGGIWELQTPIFSNAGQSPTTGDLKPTHKTVADPTWIMWADSTIGDALSNAAIRAHADTVDLFTLYYEHYSDAECRLLTSLGAVTTRAIQGSSATAYAAHCAIYPPWGAGRALAIAGVGPGLTTRILGGAVGSETETPTLSKTASHAHPASTLIKNIATGPWGMNTGQPLLVQLGGDTDSAGSSTPLNIVNPTTYLNVMIKL
jgi:hypothetical protein